MTRYRARIGVMALAVSLMMAALGVASGEEPAGAPVSPAGWLVIEGKGVATLQLETRAGPALQRMPVEGKISLMPGEYRITQIQLKAGYQAYRREQREEDWFRLAPGQSHTVRIGAPLTPTVHVQRQGRLLTLDYQLLDAEGWNYSRGDRTNPPEFRVFRGDEEIGSGNFEYG